MEPFGPENMRPVFIAKKVIDTGYSKIVKEEHIRFSLRQDECTLLQALVLAWPKNLHCFK